MGSSWIKKILFRGATLAAVSGIFGCGDDPIEPKPEPNNPPPFLLQTVQTVNDVNVQHNVSFENISELNLEVRNEPKDSLLYARTITFSPHEETFEGMPKGDNYFILSALGLTPDTATANIEDFPSLAPDFSGLDLDMNERDSLVVHLKRPTDKNSGDNPVPYISVISPDGRVIPTIGAFPLDTVLKIVANGIPGPYQIELGREGSLEKIVLPGEIFDLTNISGQLQDTRTDSGELGKIRIYNASDTTFLRETLTDTQGNFDFQLDQPLDVILLQARLETGNPNDNYIRTIVLPGRDTIGLIIRAYPYTNVLANAGISRSDFVSHLGELNPNFFKWDLDSLRGVEILDVDPLGRGSFTSAEQDATEQTFKANLTCYTGGLLNGNDLYIQKDNSSIPDSQRHYINEERNWIYVFPNNSVDRGFTRTKDENGTIYLVSIELESTTSEFVKAHEIGHAFIAPNDNHAITLPGTVTIMRSSSLTTPGPADCEAAYIVNETTYLPRSSIDDLLGLSFFP